MQCDLRDSSSTADVADCADAGQFRLAGALTRRPKAPRLRRWLAAGVVAGLLSGICLGQRAPNWRAYKLADGLPESACIAVTITPQGRVLARHLNLPSFTELDGYTVTLRSAPEVGKSRIYQSPSGQLWTIVPEGLQEFKEGAWNLYPVKEIAAELHARNGRVGEPVPMLPIRQGLVLFLLPGALMEFDCEDAAHPNVRLLRSAAQAGLGGFLGMTAARDGGLWVSGERGVAKIPGPVRSFQPETGWREYFPSEGLALTNFQSPRADMENGVIVLADSTTNQQRLIAAFDGSEWALRAKGPDKLRQAWSGPGRSVWAMTHESLLHLDEPGGELQEEEEITARQYFDAATEPGGAFWLATSSGLFRYAPLLWRTPESARAIRSPVHCLSADAEGRVWFAAGNKLHLLQNSQLEDFPLPASWNGRLQARALFWLKNGTLVLAAREIPSAAGERLFRIQATRGAFGLVPAAEPGRRLKALGLLKDGSLCVQDMNAAETPGAVWLQKYDGRRFEPLTNSPAAGRVSTNLSNVFAAQNGDLWLSGDLGTAWYHDNQWQEFGVAEQAGPAEALGFIELADGKIWCAAQDQIWEFDGRNWSVARRGFDRINDLQRARDGSIWVASNSGLYRFFRGAWVENGVEDGLASASVRELLEDSRGRLWAATTRGLSLFHPDADPDPPQTMIEEITATGSSVPAGGTVTLTFHGEDKWKYTSAEHLLYSYRLDEHDWSPFQEVNQKSFSDLPAGKHVLQVRAMDRNCNVEPRAIKEFAVILPWYQETRLILISSLGLLAALFFAALAVNRHWRLVKSYAEVERKVAERTEQLEAAGRQLLHSQKMNALGTLAAGIAHDFNNILSIIKGSTQLIEDNLDNPEKIRTRADRISTVVEQGAGIVKAMLGFSRESADPPGPCDLNAVVEETLKLLGDRFLREVRVDFKQTAGLPAVIASKDFVQQILLNFIFNAVEAMDRNKLIVLATRSLDRLPRELVLTPAEAPGYVEVSVKDTGCGISAENLPRIFEPFFTTKALSSRRGTGLGLSMVYELARKLGGGLMVESAIDRGSTFMLILPVRAATAESNTPK